jgi:hypothetical protein
MTKRRYRFSAYYNYQTSTIRQPSRKKKLHIREIRRNQLRFFTQPIDSVLILQPFHAALYEALISAIPFNQPKELSK